jgi:hypothetical protein
MNYYFQDRSGFLLQPVNVIELLTNKHKRTTSVSFGLKE